MSVKVTAMVMAMVMAEKKSNPIEARRQER